MESTAQTTYRIVVVREDRLDHLLDGLLGVKPKAAIGDVVFADKPEKIFRHPLPSPSTAGRGRRHYAALPPTTFPSDKASWIIVPGAPHSRT